MVFGTFDLLHPGHLYLLYHARLQGAALVAVVARDATAKRLKGRRPAWNQAKRLRTVKATGLVSRAVLGDTAHGSYAIIAKERPDLICLGYDQKALGADLRKKMKAGKVLSIPLKVLASYHPEVFHTSLRRKR